jgi:nitrite reductase/ring-hydroxylating ferredoxin subunit/uncharacterized membrane protein
VIERLERSDALDAYSASVRDKVAAVLDGGRRRDLLSGVRLGHPLHPALVAVPLGMWSAALVADLMGETDVAQKLTAVGLAGAGPTVATGLSDWMDTADAEQRVGLVHMGANLIATAMVGAGWVARRRGHGRVGAALGGVGLAAASVGGWLGGHLAYALGVGVDTNAFDGGPTEWTDLEWDDPASEATVRSAQADGVSLVGVDVDGLQVMANRCSHRGGPLSDGEVNGRCIRCPWHGSRFDLATGQVVQGPASVAQPVYQVRSAEHGPQVRREEPRALRVNSVRTRP